MVLLLGNNVNKFKLYHLNCLLSCSQSISAGTMANVDLLNLGNDNDTGPAVAVSANNNRKRGTACRLPDDFLRVIVLSLNFAFKS